MARLAALALLAVALLAAAGCGGGNDRRDAVSAYIDQVNSIEAKLQQPLIAVSQANREFATGQEKPAAVRTKLLQSERTLRTLHHRLAALDPPPDARKLHRLLLELVDRQGALAHEVTLLAAFFPAYSRALRPVADAGRELKAALDSKQSKVAAKADALDTYRAALGAVLVDLRRLDPPPASAPAYRTQVATIVRVRDVVARLATALREKRAGQVPGLLHEFDLAAVGNQSIAAQKAQIRAVRAYNARIRALDRLSARINTERVRLQRTL